METLVALGLAPDMVQFVELGIKIITKVNQEYKNAQGATESNQDEGLVHDLIPMIHQLSRQSKSCTDKTLVGLLKRADQLGSNLLRILDHLAVQPNARFRRMESLLRNFKGQAMKEEIGDVTSRLLTLRDHIFQHVASILKEQQAAIQANKNISIVSQVTTVIEQTISSLQLTDVSKTLDASQLPLLQDIVKKTRWIHDESRHLNKLRHILKSLSFAQIRERENVIKTAHAATFGWVFQKASGLNFMDWPSSSEGLYWITGKAGCGKSTLMKYLRNHRYLRQLMESWASNSNKKLVLSSHYFSDAGTPLQKSQEGLFRTLLFQIFRQAPEIVALVCPVRYRDANKEMDEWPLGELITAMKRVAQMNDCPVRICAFVDGLDEYTGESTGLIKLLMALSRSSNFKICVSSRPWHVFRLFFNKEWSFEVHRLTGNDILTYVRDELISSSSFQQLTKTDRGKANVESLIEEIVSKSQGVFLWVHLVVRSLQRGISKGDDIADLIARVRELPGELEPYFDRMLSNIDSEHRARIAKTIICIIHADITLPVVALHFMDMERDVHEDSWNPLEDGSVALVEELEKKKTNMMAQSLELIDISSHEEENHEEGWMFFSNTVGFLHRTVSDFLRSDHTHEILLRMAGRDFNPRPSLFLSYFAMFDLFTRSTSDRFRSDPSSQKEIGKLFTQLVLGTLYYAKEREIACRTTDIRLMRRLDILCKSYADRGVVFPWNSGVPHSSLEVIAVAVDLKLLIGILFKDSSNSPQQFLQHAAMLSPLLMKPIRIFQDTIFKFQPTGLINLPFPELFSEFGILSEIDAKKTTTLALWDDFLGRLLVSSHNCNVPSSLILQDQPRKCELEACKRMVSNGANLWVLIGDMPRLPELGSPWNEMLKGVRYKKNMRVRGPARAIIRYVPLYFAPDILAMIFPDHDVAFWEDLFRSAGRDASVVLKKTGIVSGLAEPTGPICSEKTGPGFLTRIRRWNISG